MTKALAKSDGYKTLVQKVGQEFVQMELFVRNRVAQGYWNIGKYIDGHLLEHKDRADYATGFYEKLAGDVGRDSTTLQRSVQFYRAYPIFAVPRELTWEHFRSLITVKDEKERKRLQVKVIEAGWNSTKLRKYLSAQRKLAATVSDDKPITRLGFTRGRLHTYRVVPANKSLIHRGPLALDLGFREQYTIPAGAPRLKENDTVELVFSAQGGSAAGGKGQMLTGARKVSVAEGDLFTYAAHLEKVIDGDTLLVSFDFGCPMSVAQKLRLRGIDCPEIDTPEGKRAKRFVEARLRGCDFIVVKTHKDRTDKFDRYLADIFYTPGANDAAGVAAEGAFLNQELLDARLARAYI